MTFPSLLHFLCGVVPVFRVRKGCSIVDRIPNLARTLQVTRFGSLPRSYGDVHTIFRTQQLMVAKWGEWHCGENKAKFVGEWNCEEPTLFEPFIDGEAVRIQMISEQAWQIHLDGDGWKKSLHHVLRRK